MNRTGMFWHDAGVHTTPTITIFEALEDLPDPRLGRTRWHTLPDIVVLMLVAFLVWYGQLG